MLSTTDGSWRDALSAAEDILVASKRAANAVATE